MRYRSASGNDVWVHFVISVVHDARGVPSYGVAQMEDITHRKHAEAQLQERFHELTTNVDVGFLVRQVDPPEFHYFNPAFLKIFGFDPTGPAPTHSRTMSTVSPEHAEKVDAILAAAAAGERVEATWRYVRQDGESRWVTARISPIIDADGQIRRLTGLFEDVTDRKEAEAVALAAVAEAEQANAAKTEFLSRMSHELRTPLNAVLGFGQLIEMDESSAQHQKWAKHILEAGRHLLALIDEVLDITRVEAGAIRLSMEPVRVADVVDQSVEMLCPLAVHRGIGVIVDKQLMDTHVLADHQRFRQVVVNILANAVKYNKLGGTVRIAGELLADGWFRLTISDTGIGIAEQDLPRLFQPFERLSAEGSDVEGNGLGLAFSKRLIAEMGGQIGVQSSLGRGSSFWVELPISDAPSVRIEDMRQAIDSAPSTDRRTTVLYIEDNESNVRLMEQIVARRPQVDLVNAMLGGTGLEMALTHQPDLILLDLHLPDIPGEQVLRRLRADPRTTGTPIVVLSADATIDQPKRLIDQGATSYLTKPFDIPRLLRLIDDLAATADVPAPRSVQ
jgi:PAS domain S-box-containing protein